jgi:hypothetical protein
VVDGCMPSHKGCWVTTDCICLLQQEGQGCTSDHTHLLIRCRSQEQRSTIFAWAILVTDSSAELQFLTHNTKTG